jgi:L-iditol 2-dehydrogenase
MTMQKVARAAVLGEFGAPLEIREFEIVDPEPGGLVLEMEVATVCGSDVHNWLGHTGGRLVPPVIPGHEGVGRIVAMGKGADTDSQGTPLSIGDRIVWGHANCNRCYGCTVLNDETMCSNRFIGMLTSSDRSPYLHGTFATHAHVHPRAGRLRVPDAVGSEIASAASCALRSVVAAFDRLGPLDYRHSVLIQGAGPLGLFATAVASTYSPRRVVVVGAPDARLELARELGADATVSIDAHPDAGDRAALLRELTDGRGPDVIFEFTGSDRAFGEGVDVAGLKARYVMAGAVGGVSQPVSSAQVIFKNLTVIGSLGATIGHYVDALKFVERYSDRFPWDRLVGPGRFSLDDTTAALQSTSDLKETKAVILPQGL